MEIEPEFWEWMQEGTHEEKFAKQVKLFSFVRNNRQMFTTTDEFMEKWEADIERLRQKNEKVFLAELNLRALKYEKEEADRELDKILMTEENLPIIPLYGRRKKDLH